VLFETRYFWARLAPSDSVQLRKLRMLYDESRERLVSSVTIFEIFKLSMEKEGADVAELRARAIRNEFEVVSIDWEIAREGGRFGARLRIPMADALIMATAKKLRLPVVTDDPHYTEVKRVWV
jgi:predicted nucleic acid-binding protein